MGIKVCAEYRKVLWWADCTQVLHEFACDEAERALELAGNPDPRSLKAIETKRKWLKGEATDDELAAAWAAANERLAERLSALGPMHS